MKWKIANTLFVTSIFLFIVGAVFNYYQSKNSIESSLEKARRIKKEKAEEKRAEREAEEQEEEELYAEVMEVDEIDKEIETIINKNKNGK
jgi:uncharacterized protein YktA (UPF0223 family)